jgi:hypothetical protein
MAEEQKGTAPTEEKKSEAAPYHLTLIFIILPIEKLDK